MTCCDSRSFRVSRSRRIPASASASNPHPSSLIDILILPYNPSNTTRSLHPFPHPTLTTTTTVLILHAGGPATPRILPHDLPYEYDRPHERANSTTLSFTSHDTPPCPKQYRTTPPRHSPLA